MDFVRDTTMRVNGGGREDGREQAAVLRYQIIRVVRESVRERKTACLLVHCGALSILPLPVSARGGHASAS